MKLTRSREHVINMGQYESVRVGASVELDVTDTFDFTTENKPHPRVYAKAEEILAEAMKSDLEEAISLLPAGSTSYILSWGVDA